MLISVLVAQLKMVPGRLGSSTLPENVASSPELIDPAIPSRRASKAVVPTKIQGRDLKVSHPKRTNDPIESSIVPYPLPSQPSP
jgi:hypothetical protein